MTTAKVEQAVTVRFTADVFELEAVKRAAYQMSDRLVVIIAPDPTGILCTLKPVSVRIDAASLEDEFRNEVLDQDLRLKIGRETEQVRNLILSLAFSKTGLQE